MIAHGPEISTGRDRSVIAANSTGDLPPTRAVLACDDLGQPSGRPVVYSVEQQSDLVR